MIPADLLWGLPGELVALYGRIKYRDRGEGCWAKLNDLRGTVTKRSAMRYLRALEDLGLITVERKRGDTNFVRCTDAATVDPERVRQVVSMLSPAKKRALGGEERSTGERKKEHRVVTETAPSSEVDPEVDPRSRSLEVNPPGDLFGNPVRLVLEKAPAKPKGKRKDQPAVSLPDWMPAPLWEDWRAHRKAKRAALTEQSERMQIAKLGEWRTAGHDPAAIVRESIAQGWQGLFEPKGKPAAGGRWTAQPNRPSAREDQEFTEADLDRLLEESK